jgi:putative aminopeptidase FrvX
MKLRAIAHVAACAALLMACVGGLSPTAAGQDLRQELVKFVETPAIPGYEQTLAKEIQHELMKWKPQIDTIGNVVVTIGSGAPHRVIVTPMDEPGYIVSNITSDGYLRVQRLPQTAPNPIFDSLYSAEPVYIRTRSGKIVTGVVAGLSTHLQGPRPGPAPADLHEGMYSPEDIYVDVGATSAAEVRQAGVDLLDPISIERHLYEMGYGRMTSPAIGDRFGCAALVEMLHQLDAKNVHGTLTVAFVGQQWAGARGIERILAHAAVTQKIDEMIYVGRLTRGGGGGGRGGAPAAQGTAGATGGTGAANTNADAGRGQAQGAQGGRGGRGGFVLVEPKKPDGSGALIGGSGANATLSDFSKELQDLAAKNNITASADATAPLARAADAAATFPLPARFAHLGIATKWPATPGEIIDADDLVALTQLLEVYAGGSAETKPMAHATSLLQRPALPPQAKTAPTPVQMVSALVESYGVGYHEAEVRETVKRFLPPWVKTETDDSGNLWVHLGTTSKDSKAPRIAIVAHMDEIGFEVRAIEPDGRLQVVTRGGGILEYFIAHTLLVHTANGDVPGVLELPDGWNANGFILRPPAGGGPAAAAIAGGAPAQGAATGGGAPTEGAPAGGGRGGAGGGARYVDVGARSAEEAQKLGIKAGDRIGDYITIPKKYRPLLGHRANGRSFDDRVGCSAAIAAIWELGPQLAGRDVTFVFSTGEELGLLGAGAAAKKMAAEGRAPDFVFAIDTFVSSDSPLESKRFADTEIGHGFVVRAVDNSNITPREYADRVVKLAKANNIPVQVGITGGGNDGSTFLPYGSIDVGLGWPLRYSHSPGEVIDTRDLDSLAHILAVLARNY